MNNFVHFRCYESARVTLSPVIFLLTEECLLIVNLSSCARVRRLTSTLKFARNIALNSLPICFGSVRLCNGYVVMWIHTRTTCVCALFVRIHQTTTSCSLRSATTKTPCDYIYFFGTFSV